MSFDSACGFLFYHLHYYGGCQYVKKIILIAVCVVEFSGLLSEFIDCKYCKFYSFVLKMCLQFFCSFYKIILATPVLQCTYKALNCLAPA